MSFTRQQYLKGRDVKFADEFTDELSANTNVTIARASELVDRYQRATGDTRKREVTSGWRPQNINKATPGAAPKSLHMYCQAIDIEDKDQSLGKWCVANIEVLVEIGLWMESIVHTPTWMHIQTKPPKSGNRIFLP